MKTFRKFGIQIDFSLSIRRVKRMTFSIPDWADDAHLRQGRPMEDGWGTPDGKTKICYFKGGKAFYIDVPDCKEAVEVFVTPMKNRATLAYNTNRVVIVDLYF